MQKIMTICIVALFLSLTIFAGSLQTSDDASYRNNEDYNNNHNKKSGFSNVKNEHSLTIISPKNSCQAELLAAKEVRRYIYLRTDQFLPINQVSSLPESGDLILVANDDNPMVDSLRNLINHNTNDGGFILKTVNSGGRNILVITGIDAIATLYGAYRFAEHLGVGFDLTVDAIPDAKIDLNINGFDEVAEPRFALRGIHPFHNMMAGPDNWHTSDYMVIITQLAKMGMNFIGLHTYGDAEEGSHNEGDGPDAQVWVGLESDVNADGTVSWSSPAYNAHTHRVKNEGTLRIWGYDTWDTDQFSAGASAPIPYHSRCFHSKRW